MTKLWRLRQLEDENQRLKKLVVDLSLDKKLLKQSSGANSEALGSTVSAGGLAYQCSTRMRTADEE